jgi:hypothetical protein
LPENLQCMRSGPYHLAGIVQHHGQNSSTGHYTALCWDGSGDSYTVFDDDRARNVSASHLRSSSLQKDAVLLFYTRTRYWGDSGGDGSACTPYLRDLASEQAARGGAQRPCVDKSHLQESAQNANMVNSLSSCRDLAAAAAEQRRIKSSSQAMHEFKAGRTLTSSKLALSVFRSLRAAEEAKQGWEAGLAALKAEYGEGEVQVAIEETGVARPELDGLEQLLLCRRASDMDARVSQTAWRNSVSTRWERLLENVPGFVVSYLLTAMHNMYGQRCHEVLADEWHQDWEQWDSTGSRSRSEGLLQELRPDDAPLTEEAAHCEWVSEAIHSRLCRHRILAEVHFQIPAPTDVEALRGLENAGWEKKRGLVYGKNQCLTDSLLQLLSFHGFLHRSLFDGDKQELRAPACHAFRDHLNSDGLDQLRPRRAVSGEWDADGFLEHDRHAPECVSFLMQWFKSNHPLLVTGSLPKHGIMLRVHSKTDSITGLPAYLCLCGDASLADPIEPEFHLYNFTGQDMSGIHYDPLFAAKRSPRGTAPASSSHISSGGSMQCAVSGHTQTHTSSTPAVSTSSARTGQALSESSRAVRHVEDVEDASAPNVPQEKSEADFQVPHRPAAGVFACPETARELGDVSSTIGTDNLEADASCSHRQSIVCDDGQPVGQGLADSCSQASQNTSANKSTSRKRSDLAVRVLQRTVSDLPDIPELQVVSCRRPKAKARSLQSSCGSTQPDIEPCHGAVQNGSTRRSSRVAARTARAPARNLD